jgi:hypothetical protein
MYNGNYKNDQEHAIELSKYLLDYLNNDMKKGQLISTEMLSEQLSIMFDQKCGIDCLLEKDNETVAGVALRIQQHQDKNWRTFTVRYERSSGAKTEFYKRYMELYGDRMAFYPHYTIQAYYDRGNNLIGCAVAQTKLIYDVITNKGEYDHFNAIYHSGTNVYLQTNRKDNNKFIVVPYDSLIGNGFKELEVA